MRSSGLILGVFSLLCCSDSHQWDLGLWFVEHPQFSVALPGDSVYLSCRTNLPRANEHIQWLHNQKIISPAQVPDIQTDAGDLTLQMSPGALGHRNQTGEYQCRTRLNERFAIASLPGKLSIAQLDDFMFERPKSVEAYEGNDVVIECSHVPYSNPPAFIQFYKDGMEMSGTEPGSNWELLQGETLLIHGVTPINGGNYTCSASNHITNEKKMSLSHTQLVVKALTKHEKSRLTFRPKDRYSVPKGENLTIPCIASGNPKPDIIWTRIGSNDQLQSQHGCLTIVNAQETDSGSYMCAIYNGSRRFLRKTTVIVLVPPVFTRLPRVTKPVQGAGDRVLLHCQAMGTPGPDIKWYFNGLPVRPDAGHRILGNGTLVLESITKDDEGVFQCFASNNVGKNVTNLVLEVESSANGQVLKSGELRPYPPSKPNVTQNARDSVLLTWTVPGGSGLMPIEFFKVQFREFRRGHSRSDWRTLDEVIDSRSRSFEVIGLRNHVKYRFRIVVVYSNNDNLQGALSKRFKLDPRFNLEEAPRSAPIITEVLPLSDTSLRVGWRMPSSLSEQTIEGYFIFIRKFLDIPQRFDKVTMIGQESHSYIFENLEPGQNYAIKVEAFNYAGPSPGSRITRRSTLPSTMDETQVFQGVSSDSSIQSQTELLGPSSTTTAQDILSDDQMVLYLVIAGILVGVVLVLVVCCSVVGCIQKKQARKNLTNSNVAIHEKYLDTSRHITLAHSSRASDIHNAGYQHPKNNPEQGSGYFYPSDQQLSSEDSQTVETSFSSPNRLSQMLGHSNHQFSGSLMVNSQLDIVNQNPNLVSSYEGSLSGVEDTSFQNEDESSLGFGEYSAEPSRASWKRRRRSEEIL